MLDLPWTLRFFQEWMKYAHTQIANGKETDPEEEGCLRLPAWKPALTPVCGLTGPAQKFLVTPFVLKNV